MFSTLSRRALLMGMTAMPMLALPALASEPRFTDDVVVGDENAPLTVFEYVSFSCPHCANFHKHVWPEIKAAYVDTGKVKFIFREVFFNRNDLRISLISRCGGPASYYPLADLYLNSQSTWSRAPDPATAIEQVAKRAGMPQATMTACVADEDFQKTLVENYRRNAEQHGIRSTPSFVIEGTTHAGGMAFEEFAKLLDDALSS
ncbi:MAG: DsbA family protein [Paracoccaceae bacterium]